MVWAVYGLAVGAVGGSALQDGRWAGLAAAVVIVALLFGAARLLTRGD